MKVLFVDFALPYLLRDSEYPAGGWATQLMQWLDGLAGAGHEAGVLTWKGARAYVEEAPPCELIETYDPKRGVKVLKYFYLFIPSLLGGARRFAPDVVVQSAKGVETAIMSFIAACLGVPFVHRIASDIDADGRYRSELPFYARIAYRLGLMRADLIICQNTYQHEQLRRRFPEKRLHILPNAFSPGDNARPWAQCERSYIAWLGIFKQPKNLPLLHRVAAALPEMQFRVAGMASRHIDEDSKRALAQLQDLPNVQLVGHVKREAVIDFMAGARALLCTSDYEGFPNVFLEALAAGTPVVTRATVDPSAMIRTNALGHVAPDESALRAGLKDVWSLGPQEFESLSDRCRRYVALHHAPPLVMREFVSAVEALRPAKL